MLGAVAPWQARQGGARPAVAVPALFSTGRKKKAGWAQWTKRSSRSVGRLGQMGQKLKEIPFLHKNWIFEFTRSLEFCTRRFRRNFDRRIFPNFF
jgi:hypothetical protein